MKILLITGSQISQRFIRLRTLPAVMKGSDTNEEFGTIFIK